MSCNECHCDCYYEGGTCCVCLETYFDDTLGFDDDYDLDIDDDYNDGVIWDDEDEVDE